MAGPGGAELLTSVRADPWASVLLQHGERVLGAETLEEFHAACTQWQRLLAPAFDSGVAIDHTSAQLLRRTLGVKPLGWTTDPDEPHQLLPVPAVIPAAAPATSDATQLSTGRSTGSAGLRSGAPRSRPPR